MISLPEEIITMVLEDDDISIEDIVRFSSTCKRFRQIVQNKSLWDTKYYQRYFYLFIYKIFFIILFDRFLSPETKPIQKRILLLLFTTTKFRAVT